MLLRDLLAVSASDDETTNDETRSEVEIHPHSSLFTRLCLQDKGNGDS